MTLGTIPVSGLSEVVARGQCIGCGFCQISLNDTEGGANVDLVWSGREEHWVPTVSDPDRRSNEPRVCPGAAMDMVALSQRMFGNQPSDPMVGEHNLIAAGHAKDDAIRRAAASGGMTTAILTHLFEVGVIDAAYCSFGRSPVGGKGQLVRTSRDLGPAMGSHYHPVNFGAFLAELAKGSERFAFVGLPCEVAALRQLMWVRPDIAARCVLVIGLFCGGINRFSGVARYLSSFGIGTGSVREIDYRDGPWPGHIRVVSDQEEYHIPRILNNTRWRILRYMISFQGYWMLPRCRICPDQIADFADIAVGDPHLARFKSSNSPGHSAVIARTIQGRAVLLAAQAAGAITLEPLSPAELVQSQGYTLENRRQATLYAKVATRLGMTPPFLTVYHELKRYRSAHQTIYAYVDLIKIRVRNWRWLRPFYLPIQVFEYLFLTFSVRLLIERLRKLVTGI